MTACTLYTDAAIRRGEQKRQDQKEEREEGEIFSNFISQDIQPLRNQQTPSSSSAFFFIVCVSSSC